MSGPVRTTDTDPDGVEAPAVPAPVVELTPSRAAQLGPQLIHRALPTRARRTVGAWCFLDHAPPGRDDGANAGTRIGPHPHIGLQTVTWVLSGEVVHTDSLGSEQPIRPGELNLMTAGGGIAHAEQTPQHATGGVHLVQLWVAQPETARHGAPAFEHHPTLPQAELAGCRATVVIGSFAGATSPARADTDHVGVDVVVDPGRSTVPLHAAHEHAVVLLEGLVEVDGTPIGPDVLAYLGGGRDELTIVARERSRLFLLGGTPFEARPLMWWNFVAREHAEIDAAYRDWQQGAARFGPVASDLAPVPAPTPPWMRDAAPFRR
jgi:redox-sensitive bicupin YhaK (pirin superfamily)